MSCAVVADRARLDRLQAADALERRRLARAVGADQADELALADVEVDALDRLDAAVGDLELPRSSSSGWRCDACVSRVITRALQIERDVAAEVRGDHLRILLHLGGACPRRSSCRSRAPARGRRRSSRASCRARSAGSSCRRGGCRSSSRLQRRRLGRVHARRRARRARAAWARWRARARSRAGAGRRRRGAWRACWRASRRRRIRAARARASRSPPPRRASCASRKIAPSTPACVRTWRPIITFSSADRLANRRMFWNVRAMPRAATSLRLQAGERLRRRTRTRRRPARRCRSAR